MATAHVKCTAFMTHSQYPYEHCHVKNGRKHTEREKDEDTTEESA